MSGYFYKGKLSLINGEINWLTGVIKVSLVKNYTPVYATHQFINDVNNAGGTISGAGILGGRAMALSTSTVQFTTTGATLSTTPNEIASNWYWIMYQSSGPNGGADLPVTQQRLIAYYDTGTGLPVNPIGTAVSLTWSTYALGL